MKELLIALLILTVLIAGCVSQSNAQQNQDEVIQQSIDNAIDQEIDNALNNISMDDVESEIGQQI